AVRPHVSELGRDLGEVLLRLLRSLGDAEDRRVLTPMYLREITYRLMRAEQVARLLEAADAERERRPVSEVIRYVNDHLAEPMTVADMARHVGMSASALTNAFVDEIGIGPYQYAKRVRLDRACALLIQGDLNVSEVMREVGYTSLSHFINEFKRQFGATPRAYARARREIVAMRVDAATNRPPAKESTGKPT
ncbi:helix-turn-helix domain-containing protein, partial [Actinomadura adrarensis]